MEGKEDRVKNNPRPTSEFWTGEGSGKETGDFLEREISPLRKGVNIKKKKGKRPTTKKNTCPPLEVKGKKIS